MTLNLNSVNETKQNQNMNTTNDTTETREAVDGSEKSYLRRMKDSARQGIKKLADAGRNLVSKKSPTAGKKRSLATSSTDSGISPDVLFIQAGSTLNLMGPDADVQHPRRYWLNGFQDRLYFTPDFGEESAPDDDDPRPEFIDVMDVTEIRAGCRTDDFLRVAHLQGDYQVTLIHPDRCFSIHYGSDNSIHSLQAADPQTARRWIDALESLVWLARIESKMSQYDPTFWLRHFYRNAVGPLPEAGLSFWQCTKLIHELNVKSEPGRARVCFDEANTNREPSRGRQVLDEDEFIAFFHLISHRPALDELFARLSGGSASITAEQLRVFLTDVQGLDDVDLDEAERLIETIGCDSLPGFRALMTSEMFDIRRKEHRTVNQDMTKPLACYWAKTSHNTYLTRDQLVGPSSIEGYVRAQDCASVELDLWNGPDGQPIIKHGRSLVTSILARDALEYGIKPYVFQRDDYPVILSIEDHLSDAQRQIFIADFERIFGKDHVLRVDEEASAGYSASPEQLRRKVIIKADRKTFGPLANVCQTRKYDPTAEDEIIPCVSSLSETRVAGIIDPPCSRNLFCPSSVPEESLDEFIHRTGIQLIRVFPRWTRQLSGNFDAIRFMNVGCQMVALNIQTRGKELALYAGRFRANGDCGFALKPDFLIHPEAFRFRRPTAKTLTLTIISAQQLPKDKRIWGDHVDPFVEVTMDGVEQDKSTQQTRIVIGNGLNPVWNKKMTFRVTEPDLAVVLFSVEHFGIFCNTTLGSYALPLMSLGQGYRHVPLQDKHLVPVPLATLFVHVHVEDDDFTDDDDDDE